MSEQEPTLAQILQLIHSMDARQQILEDRLPSSLPELLTQLREAVERTQEAAVRAENARDAASEHRGVAQEIADKLEDLRCSMRKLQTQLEPTLAHIREQRELSLAWQTIWRSVKPSAGTVAWVSAAGSALLVVITTWSDVLVFTKSLWGTP